ncbi:MAG: amidohydrolase family protein [Myxococcaceae bacterium]|nr:amidohydrolase family protein [Myxococcaceae bacterium]
MPEQPGLSEAPPSSAPPETLPVESTPPQAPASEPPSQPGPVGQQPPETPTEQPPARPAPYAYCDASAAIAAYPRFSGQLPEVVARLHPSGGRDYPVIDAHTHLGTSAAEEADAQRRIGLYAAVQAHWDAGSTAQQRATYKKPNIIQFNLGQYLSGLDALRLPAIQAALDGQRAAGAGGIKIFKDLGLAYNDSSGARLRVDDPRLYPLWQRAADEKWAVSIHVADPDSWMDRYYPDSPYSKQELIRQFIRVVEDNPRTVFVAIHMLNLHDSEAELDQLGEYLERYPNLYADSSARSQYLVHRDQAHVRDFMIKHQDKLLFATDRAEGKSIENYEEELRYWETTAPTRTFYLASKANGLGLPPEVLEKFYYKNALRVFCAQLSAVP